MTRRILIIRLSALGDILHALPVLAALRRHLPGAHLGWLVQDGGAPLVVGHPMLDRVHVLPRRAMKSMSAREKLAAASALRRELRVEGYDTAIDLQGLTKSAVWTRLCGARERIGFRGENARELSAAFYNRAVAPAADRTHVIDMNLALLAPLGIDDARVEFPVRLPEEAVRRGREIWGERGEGEESGDDESSARPDAPRVVINPGAGWPTKQWPAERWGHIGAELARRHGARVALAWGPGEQDLVRAALGAADDAAVTLPDADFAQLPPVSPGPGVHALPQTSFVELGGVLRRANLYLGGDTGPSHLAAALGVPTVSLFGASDSARNGPRGASVETIRAEGPACIPCWKTRCRWHDPLACLTGIPEESVLLAARRLADL